MGFLVQEPKGSRKRVQGVQACTPHLGGPRARVGRPHESRVGGVSCARHAEPQRRTAFQPDTGVSPPVRSRAHSVGSRTRTGITTRIVVSRDSVQFREFANKYRCGVVFLRGCCAFFAR